MCPELLGHISSSLSCEMATDKEAKSGNWKHKSHEIQQQQQSKHNPFATSRSGVQQTRPNEWRDDPHWLYVLKCACWWTNSISYALNAAKAEDEQSPTLIQQLGIFLNVSKVMDECMHV